jgi:uncharacterized coiled-coil protein SlyX
VETLPIDETATKAELFRRVQELEAREQSQSSAIAKLKETLADVQAAKKRQDDELVSLRKEVEQLRQSAATRSGAAR